MTKSDLIQFITDQTGMTRVRSETAVNAIFDSMIEALMKNERIEIRGFGSFVNRDYEAYKGRNPQTGEVIHVRQKRTPFFKVGKDLRELISEPLISERK